MDHIYYPDSFGQPVFPSHQFPCSLSFSSPEGLDGPVVPPLLQVPVLVELAPLVIESVRHLVSDHDTDPAVVEGLREMLRVEERLQDPRREHCREEGRHVLGIHMEAVRCILLFYMEENECMRVYLFEHVCYKVLA